jgi:hypothetical protein
MIDDLDPRSNGGKQEKWAEQTQAFRILWEDAEEGNDLVARACGDQAVLWVDAESPNPNAPAPCTTYEELAGWLYAFLAKIEPLPEVVNAIAWLLCWDTKSARNLLDETLDLYCRMGTTPCATD